MIRGATLLWLVVAIGVGVGMFLLKYQVQAMEGKLASVQRQIRLEQESIHAAKADWSYLNDPIRLRELAERHVEMKPVKVRQMVSIDALPKPLDTKPQVQPQGVQPPIQPPGSEVTPPARTKPVQSAPLTGAELASVRR